MNAGAQLNVVGELINAVYMYHTSQRSSVGFEVNFKRHYQFQGTYTTHTAAIRKLRGWEF
jgi:hypothetical protein